MTRTILWGDASHNRGKDRCRPPRSTSVEAFAYPWVVGSDDVTGDNPGAARWTTNHGWKFSTMPTYPSQHGLEGVVATGPGQAWAVGFRLTTDYAYRTLIFQHTQTGWHDLGGPNVAGAADNELRAIARVPGQTTMFAVGGAQSETGDQPLILERP